MTSPSWQAEEERLEPLAPGYLAQVRRSAAHFAHADPTALRSLAALAALRRRVGVDLDVPTRSRVRPARLLKVAVKLLIRWYLRYVGDQMTAFGQSVAALGEAVLAHLDALDDRDAAARRELQELERRVERLEGTG